ncbi:hypothetical protein [Sorangium sp. So ce1153]|uniref:hypothetical protein n=1 Tax=Sorangium sp. So ce1153 TaxID=3133333 RepID=UPI003F5EB5E6
MIWSVGLSSSASLPIAWMDVPFSASRDLHGAVQDHREREARRAVLGRIRRVVLTTFIRAGDDGVAAHRASDDVDRAGDARDIVGVRRRDMPAVTKTKKRSLTAAGAEHALPEIRIVGDQDAVLADSQREHAGVVQSTGPFVN